MTIVAQNKYLIFAHTHLWEKEGGEYDKGCFLSEKPLDQALVDAAVAQLKWVCRNELETVVRTSYCSDWTAATVQMEDTVKPLLVESEVPVFDKAPRPIHTYAILLNGSGMHVLGPVTLDRKKLDYTIVDASVNNASICRICSEEEQQILAGHLEPDVFYTEHDWLDIVNSEQKEHRKNGNGAFHAPDK